MNTVQISFGTRLVIAVVDNLIVLTLTVIPTVILSKFVGPTVASFVGGMLGLAYASLEVINARTVGKMICKCETATTEIRPSNDGLVNRVLTQIPQALALVAAIPAMYVLAAASLLPVGLVVLGMFVVFALPERPDPRRAEFFRQPAVS